MALLTVNNVAVKGIASCVPKNIEENAAFPLFKEEEATIPLTMTTEIGEKLRNENLKLVACGFGVGLSWGSVYFETNRIVCPELIEI